LMMMHALGTGTHADDPVVVTGAAYKHGLSGIWYTFVYLFVTPFYWVIAPFFRRSRFITTADFFKVRFGSKMALLYSIMGVITFALYTGMMLKATGTLAHAVTQGVVPEWLAISAMTAVFVAYGLAGGLVATVVTESIQGLLIVIMSLLLVPFGLIRVGGFSRLHEILSADKFSLHAPTELTIPWIITGSIMMLIGIVSQPHIMEVCSTGKTEFEGRVGFTYGNFVKRFCAMGWALTGVIVLALVTMPNGIPPLGVEREAAFGTAIRVLLPAGFTGLMFAAILAAQMSTLSAFMVASSALLARNIYKEHINPDANDRQLLSLARWIGLIVVGIGVTFALCVSGVAQALVINWAVSTLTGIFMWFGVLWRRTNATGAWVSFAVMTAIWLVLGPAGGVIKNFWQTSPAIVGIYADKSMLQNLGLSFLPAGILALVIGSIVADRTKSRLPAFIWLGVVAIFWVAAHDLGVSFGTFMDSGKVALMMNNCLFAAVLALLIGMVFPSHQDKRKLEEFYLLLKTPVGREEELRKAGVEVVYAGHSEGHPWELKHSKLVNIGGFLVALVFSLIILGILWGISRIGA
ncbi:MAG: sodium:solute symporter family protein, partial [Armatimonadota bacterium]|nr:sodium:solute symporter family protein [Armatimonadota bacterium]